MTLAPVATYSIVARDPGSGALGVAVQSHYFSVGTVVPWAEAGVGAVATQSLVRIDYGPRGLEAMRSGASAPEALAALVAADDNAAVRQVGMVDAAGRAAAHTGGRCIADAGDSVGDGYTVQANLMARPGVWPAMAEAYEGASGELPARLLTTLAAAEAAGGDIRGRQSAALLVVAGGKSPRPWEDVVVDLRVEDHPEPVAELMRLLALRRAYDLADAGDGYLAAGRPDKARDAFVAAAGAAPGVVELPFWAAVSLYAAGDTGGALEIFGDVFRRDRRWVAVLERVAAAGLFTGDEADVARVLAVAIRTD